MLNLDETILNEKIKQYNLKEFK
ncbi:MAG: hypothetical protein LUC34_00795 [Campylobacter sp.]|nr:hypothetical protein [Campylobacter sp.]